ncbi:unnamed protein product [Gongylonema pulchrum]|uniref:VWFC domain-containing protein n=1 Tax=Gongylonema pulchrum TaxID=637853 RepID=A0A183D3Y1_9BILA|nr:unnamed protein product [Gongylonema pulchrum]
MNVTSTFLSFFYIISSSAVAEPDHIYSLAKPESCRLSDSEYMMSGFSWTTVDCRQCICQKGEITCSEKRCEPGDCYHNSSNPQKTVICPNDQHCVIATEDECLKAECNYPRGRCMSWTHVNSGMARRICRERLDAGLVSTQGCSRMHLEFDMSSLPKVTFKACIFCCAHGIQLLCHLNYVYLLLDLTCLTSKKKTREIP